MSQNHSFDEKYSKLFHLTLGMLYLLILEGILGTAASLTPVRMVRRPGSILKPGKSGSIISKFFRSVNFHHPALSIHVILGLFLVYGSVTVLISALQTSRRLIKGASVVGVVAILVAAVAGADLTSSFNAAAVLTMAIAAGVALASYVVLLGLQ